MALGRECGSSCDSKGSPRLAKTVPGVENETRKCPGLAQPCSGEREEASPPGTWLLSHRLGLSNILNYFVDIHRSASGLSCSTDLS